MHRPRFPIIHANIFWQLADLRKFADSFHLDLIRPLTKLAIKSQLSLKIANHFRKKTDH